MARLSLLVLLTTCLSGLTTTPALAAEAPDVSGMYICDGVNAEGRPYRGIVEIVRNEDAFELKWTFPTSDESSLGVGIVTNGVLAVSYYGGTTSGVVVYKIDGGKKMTGEWTVAGGGGVFRETLTRMPDKGTHGDDGAHDPSLRPKRPIKGDDSKLIEG